MKENLLALNRTAVLMLDCRYHWLWKTLSTIKQSSKLQQCCQNEQEHFVCLINSTGFLDIITIRVQIKVSFRPVAHDGRVGSGLAGEGDSLALQDRARLDGQGHHGRVYTGKDSSSMYEQHEHRFPTQTSPTNCKLHKIWCSKTPISHQPRALTQHWFHIYCSCSYSHSHY